MFKRGNKMNKPIVANIKPTKVSLIEGKDYYFCQCGRSQNQPYCDGSHAVTDITPMPYKAIESRDAFLCQCKHSSNFPFCDGTHNQFDENHIGKEY
jgi:CDGSH-type Zn-finger protein